MPVPIVYRRRGIAVAETWFVEPSPEDARGEDLLRVMDVLTPTSSHGWRATKTLLIDLAQPEEALLAQLESGTRYKIKRAAAKDGLTVRHDDMPDLAAIEEFAARYEDFSRPRGLSPVFMPRMRLLAESGALTLSAVHDGDNRSVDVRHATLRTAGRSMLLYSVSNLDGARSSAQRNLIGRGNRLLHWLDLLHFKNSGALLYDFGGIDVSGNNPDKAGIADFKRGFGGAIHASFSRTLARSWKGYAVVKLLKLSGREY